MKLSIFFLTVFPLLHFANISVAEQLFGGPGPGDPSKRTAADFINPAEFTSIPGIPKGTTPLGADHEHSLTCGCLTTCNCSIPQGHAPIGVMGDHTHKFGEWMASYRYMFMRMEQNYNGSDSVADGNFAGPPPAPFRVAPTDMDMHMHMLGLMYAPTDRLTLMGMVNLVDLSMNHQNLMNGVKFKTEASGLGDSSLSALFRFWDQPGQSAHVGLGVLLPTAEVDKQDVIPGPGKTRLPYPMQLGAGSWGLAPSLTYLGQSGDWSWGAQLNAKVYLADNDEGYRLGNRGEATIWASRGLTSWLSLSARVTGSNWGNITGRDSDLLPLPVPTADPKRRGGSRLDASLGLNLLLPLEGARLAAEFGVPFWQDLDGPQLATEWWTVLGAKFSF